MLAKNKVNDIVPPKVYKKTAFCKECSKSFTKYSSFKRHVNKFHYDNKKSISLVEKHYKFKCAVCKKNFSHLKHLKFHKRINHPKITDIQLQTSVKKCPLCSYTKFSKSELFDHFKTSHDLPITTEILQFCSFEEFMQWKIDLEKKSSVLFVNRFGTRTNLNLTKRLYYKCYRSGVYKSRGKSPRHLKRQISKKINGYCPSELNVTICTSGMCKVVWVKTHVGHNGDLGNLKLTSTGKPKIKSSENIEPWISEMKSNGCVLFYNARDITCDKYPYLKKEDFVLIIMTNSQLELLQKYGSFCICVDTTHGLDTHGFELTTVSILDHIQEGFPCTFMLSNHTNEQTMTILFLEIKEKLGSALKPKIFMSDMTYLSYNAWINTMHPAMYRLFCSWHVDHAWRCNISKIYSGEERVIVYKQLRRILQERDRLAFTNLLENFMSFTFSAEGTIEFGKYFKSHYLKNIESWAYWFRFGGGLNTNMHIEQMHRAIKSLYLDLKHVKRPDTAMDAIMKFTEHKLFERQIILNKGKISAKFRDLQARHQASESIDINNVVSMEIGWQVSSSHETYTVEEGNIECDCKLRCKECDVCLHGYSCTCVDSCIRWNLCKHIHVVCRFRKIYDGGDLEIENNNELLISELTNNSTEEVNSEEILRAEKEKLKMSLLQILDDIGTMKEFNAAKQIVSSIQPTVMAIRKQANQ